MSLEDEVRRQMEQSECPVEEDIDVALGLHYGGTGAAYDHKVGQGEKQKSTKGNKYTQEKLRR